MSKRSTLDGFLQPNKKPKTDTEPPKDPVSSQPATEHATYPFAVPALPDALQRELDFSPAADVRQINDKPDLDLAYYAPFMPPSAAKQLFHFLRKELFFYRVQYMIKRGSVETQINTPRFTTVFGVDATSSFTRPESKDSSQQPADVALVEKATGKPIAKDKYSCTPRPIPDCLNTLMHVTEAITGETFNFCLVNYYASGNDSISYHSDDERFLGTNPSIASFSLGGRRDFMMRHKPLPANSSADSAKKQAIEDAASKPTKLPLASGDMILMRGTTQSLWLHSIPKRKGGEADSMGRINITFRKALVKGGTENYYRYNVGHGQPFKWSESKKEMLPWTAS